MFLKRSQFIDDNSNEFIAIIDLFTSCLLNKGIFDGLTQRLQEKGIHNQTELDRVKSGRLSIFDLLTFSRTNPIVLNMTIEILLNSGLIYKLGMDSRNNETYVLNEEAVQNLHQKDCIYNVLGYHFVFNKYKNSVVKFVASISGDLSIGTGFIFSFNNTSLIITNEHNINGDKFEVIDSEDKKIDCQLVFRDETLDLAVLKFKSGKTYVPFYFTPEYFILEDIITIGYPKVNFTKDAYQLVHMGELNAIVETMDLNKFLVLSAKTNPGNSGSPVINHFGEVVGIISRDFIEQPKDKINFEGSRYFAAIPSDVILQKLNEELK